MGPEPSPSSPRPRTTAAWVAASAAPTVAPLAIARGVASALRRVFDGRALKIEVSGSESAQLCVDPQDLAEMLGNLMENACNWARARVQVSVAVAAGMIVVTVSDDGPRSLPGGMPGGHHARDAARPKAHRVRGGVLRSSPISRRSTAARSRSARLPAGASARPCGFPRPDAMGAMDPA